MTLLRKVTNKIKQVGILSTLVLIGYKFFPRIFRALPLRTTESSCVDYYAMLKEVYDFSDETTVPTIVNQSADRNLKRIIWFVPNWSNVWGGGHYTLFRFANQFQNNHGVENIIYIYNNNGTHADGKFLENDLRTALPDCKIKVLVDLKDLPECDVAIATTWQSAYDVRNFNKTRSKFYFMQDYESLFYAGGSAAMQANLTYGFGFKGITGGTWLRSIFESYGGTAQNYVFATDKSIFYPNKNIRKPVKRIFFYGRPSTERRAFELGIACLKKIKDNYPHIEIVIAGLSGVQPPPFECTMMGGLPLKDTGDLYRSCDIGIAFSGTNLSYLPLELMACGVAVVSNSGPQVEWYCKDGVNCLIADPTPHQVFEKVKALIENDGLREKLVQGGLESTGARTWEDEIEKIYSYIEQTF